MWCHVCNHKYTGNRPMKSHSCNWNAQHEESKSHQTCIHANTHDSVYFTTPVTTTSLQNMMLWNTTAIFTCSRQTVSVMWKSLQFSNRKCWGKRNANNHPVCTIQHCMFLLNNVGKQLLYLIVFQVELPWLNMSIWNKIHQSTCSTQSSKTMTNEHALLKFFLKPQSNIHQSACFS